MGAAAPSVALQSGTPELLRPLRNRFADYLDVLQSTERIMVTGPPAHHDDFQQFADVWLSRIGGLQAIGWIQRATASQLAG